MIAIQGLNKEVIEILAPFEYGIKNLQMITPKKYAEKNGRKEFA